MNDSLFIIIDAVLEIITCIILLVGMIRVYFLLRDKEDLEE